MMIRRITSYIKNDKLQFKYIDKSLYILNYKEIKNINNNLVELMDFNNNRLIIKGNDLKLIKMVSEEALIKGDIKSIEMVSYVK